MLRLAAKPVSQGQRQHGNGILYGGDWVKYDFEGPVEPRPIFLVETDYGNRMRLSWTEVLELFDVIEVVKYEDWAKQRAYNIENNSIEQPFGAFP